MVRARGEPGTFVVCIDLELAWGFVFNESQGKVLERLRRGREAVPRLLDAFDAHDVPATWATVGHLFLGDCGPFQGPAHPEIERPSYPWRREDWFASDPRSDEASAPLWYGADLLEDIRRRSAGHEIASHSFGHLLYGLPGCGREEAASDLAAAVRVARTASVELRSFVFPQHLQGHAELLPAHGFANFRGTVREPFQTLPGPLRKALRFAVLSAGIPPPPEVPVIRSDGLVDMPASMHFAFPAGRMGGVVRPAALARRCRLGVERAIRTGRMFHIYFHDHNMGIRTEDFFQALGSVLRHVEERRAAGDLRVLTMAQYGDLLRSRSAASA